MTKNELIEALMEKSGLTRSQATKAVEGTMEVMKETFIKREDIFLRGLGTFKIVERKGKVAQNISKGTSMIIPRHHIVKFIPCKDLKSKVQ